MQTQLQDRVAIVTGAGQGLGATIATELAASGARVVINDLNPDRTQRVVTKIRDAGGQAIDVVADISNKFQCVHLVETARAKWGQLDILVNNAAVEPVSSILKMDEWDWDRCIDVNLKGTFFMSQLVGRVMADENQERGGVIINIGSLTAFSHPQAGRAAWGASKAAIVAFAQECAQEFAAYGIRVGTIVPDLVDVQGEALAHGPPVVSPVRLSQAVDVARTVRLLCTDDADIMTGSVIAVTGGWSLG